MTTKHEPVEMTLAEIINRMSPDDSIYWWEIIGEEIEGIEEANNAEDFERASEIEAAYLKEHENDRYLVSWPEHVSTPKFNSDANYQPA